MSEPVIIAILIVVTSTAAYASLSAAPWIPTRRREREALFGALDLSDVRTAYDLGSGDGSVLFDLKSRRPECRAVGLELFVLPYLWSLGRRLLGWRRYRGLRFLYRDLFRYDISDADLVFSFLLAKCYDRLKEKFARELKDDCLVVVEAWPVKGVRHEQMIRPDGNLPMYIYRGRAFRE